MNQRVAIYCRVSTAGQEENSSLGTQEANGRRHATERDWTVVEVFRDVHTGSELFERPGLTALRDAVRRGEIDVVIAHAIDRVSRNQAHLGFLLSEWDHAGVRLELVTEDLADTPEGRLLQSVRSFVAEVERLKIAERSKRGVQARVAGGKPMPGQKAPYGYLWIDGEKSRLQPDPATWPTAQRIFTSLLGGQTLRSLARTLTAEGVPTPTGRNARWEVSSIQSMLSNPIYTGRAFAFRTTQERHKGSVRTTVKPESEWVALPDGIAPAMLTQAEFDAIQARLAYNRLVAPRNNVNPEHALLRCGVARCGYCDRPLSVTSRRERMQGHMYRCHPVNRDRQSCPSFGVMAHILDRAVWEQVEQVLRQPEVIAREVERRAQAETVTDDLRSIDRRITEVKQQQVRLAKAVATLEDEAAVQPLLTELQALAEATKVLDREREEVERRKHHEEELRGLLLKLSEWCARVAGNLPTLEYHERRMVVEALGLGVRVFKADHDPRWEITMAPLPIEPAEDGTSTGYRIRSTTGMWP